jgi:hypothetical protein
MGGRVLGASERVFHVGGSSREFADPRLNEGVLTRLAASSGGRYLRTDQAGELADLLTSASPQVLAPVQRDLWDRPWILVVVILLLSVEWTLRRRWGFR